MVAKRRSSTDRKTGSWRKKYTDKKTSVVPGERRPGRKAGSWREEY
jgi:hypothetical protein